MKKSTFSPAQIAGILKEFDNGKSAEEINREHGVVLTIIPRTGLTF